MPGDVIRIREIDVRNSADWGRQAVTPSYDMHRGQEGSLRHAYTDPVKPAITYDWRNGSAIVRHKGSIIGMAVERGGIYSCALQIGSEKIEKIGLDGIKQLWLFVELWVSSVTAGAGAAE